MDPEAETMGKLFAKATTTPATSANGTSTPTAAVRRSLSNDSTDSNTGKRWNVATITILPIITKVPPSRKTWEGYDAIAQTNDAIEYLKSRDKEKPFLLTLSWGPPHDPYDTAPQKYLDLIDENQIELRDNVSDEDAAEARTHLRGYYAYILALDDCLKSLSDALDETGLAENTIFVFWSDHGDMILSHGELFKQRPWEESIRVPLLIRFPEAFGCEGMKPPAFINTPDILPTLLGLCGIDIPDSIDGSDYSSYLFDSPNDSESNIEAPANSALLACQSPFGQFTRDVGGREYRGLRTDRYTYVRDLTGPWLLYDNESDPFQLNNLVDDLSVNGLVDTLDRELAENRAEHDDSLIPGIKVLEKFGYADNVDETGTMPFLTNGIQANETPMTDVAASKNPQSQEHVTLLHKFAYGFGLRRHDRLSRTGPAYHAGLYARSRR